MKKSWRRCYSKSLHSTTRTTANRLHILPSWRRHLSNRSQRYGKPSFLFLALTARQRTLGSARMASLSYSESPSLKSWRIRSSSKTESKRNTDRKQLKVGKMKSSRLLLMRLRQGNIHTLVTLRRAESSMIFMKMKKRMRNCPPINRSYHPSKSRISLRSYGGMKRSCLT
jgi:hypothetical protein